MCFYQLKKITQNSSLNLFVCLDLFFLLFSKIQKIYNLLINIFCLILGKKNMIFLTLFITSENIKKYDKFCFG